MAVLLWEGLSPFNGQRIGALATLDSDNPKTGKSVQVWILLYGYSPGTAVRSGRDEAVCGACPHRPSLGYASPCYVQAGRAPGAVWRAWRDGRLQSATVPDVRAIAQRHGLLRLGAYGDPAFAPIELLLALAQGCNVTGYTHQWRVSSAQPYKALLMASVDTEAEAIEASNLGWRYFRVGRGRMHGEVICPASREAGARLQCRDCKACNGLQTDRKGNIVIQAH